MNYRREGGRVILEIGEQVRRLDDSTYEVKSQTTPNTKYTLSRTTGGWDCSCPDTTPFCKHAYALERRLGPKARADRGLMMHEACGQVERIAPDHYLVKSQSTDQAYEVRDFGHGWMCSCPDHLHTISVCKHIQAVQFKSGERTVVRASGEVRCASCDSADIVRAGTAGRKKGKVQRFLCNACGVHFVSNPGFRGKHSKPEHITLAVGMLYGGLSSRKTAERMTGSGLTVTHQTVMNWARQFGDLMEQFAESLIPLVGELWRTDELYMGIRGERKYLFAMLDAETRYWIARQVATHKGTDDVRPMFRKAREVAGKRPAKLRSDGALNFAEAHHAEYAPRNFLWKDSVHESHIRMDGDTNNNQMESFNGNTLRMREKVTRGLKREDSAIISGLHIYHNFLRPHLGLPEGMTPAEAAGIHVEGADKILTLVRAASALGAAIRAAARSEAAPKG